MSSRTFVLCFICFVIVVISLAVAYRIHSEYVLSQAKIVQKDIVQNAPQYTEEEKKAIYVAIEHVRNVEAIKDCSIQIQRVNDGIAYDDDNPPSLDASDWVVDIVGDPSYLNAYTAVVDSDTYEFLFSIPLA